MDVRSVSRWFGAVSLVVGGVALTVGTAIEPSSDDDSVSVALAKISRHQSAQRWLLVADLLAAFMLPAILCLMRLARRRAPRTALAGGTLAFAGWLGGLVGLGALDVVFYHGSRASDRAQAASLIDAVTHDWTYTALLVTFIVGQVLGMLLLAAALWRARVVPRFAAALIGLGPIVLVAVHDSGNGASAAVYAAIAVGLASCAVAAVRVEDGEWDVAAIDLGAHRRVDVGSALVSSAPTSG